MKFQNLKLMVFAMVFITSNLHLAAISCPAGQRKNSHGKCVKAGRVDRAHDKKTAIKASPMRATYLANNAIDAYNKALTSTTPDTAKIQKAQQAAINAINNLTAVYNQYLEIVSVGKNAVAYITKPFTANNVQTPVKNGTANGYQNYNISDANYMMNNSSYSTDATSQDSYVSQCGDGSTAMCDDGSDIKSLPCGDDEESISDDNGMCPDGSLVECASGNRPVCADGTYPW